MKITYCKLGGSDYFAILVRKQRNTFVFYLCNHASNHVYISIDHNDIEDMKGSRLYMAN
jgi:hypothetical protein